jgi:hypothetical protein
VWSNILEIRKRPRNSDSVINYFGKE